MTDQSPQIKFFTDNDVADQVGDFLSDSGYIVIRLRDVMLTDSPDPIVAATCRENGLVLLTHNIKHFRQIVRDHEVTKAQTDRLCRVELGCKQMLAAQRVADALSIIVSEWERLDHEKSGLRIFIGDSIIRLHR